MRSDEPSNSGRASDFIVSPKVSLAWRASESAEFYASFGRGFHSNDARGATSTLDPATGDPVAEAPLYIAATGAELGVRIERGSYLGAISLWGLDLDSELVFAGDAGASELSGATLRYGVEILATYSLWDWLTLDASAAWTRARFREAPGSNRVPNAADYVITGGATAQLASDWAATLTVRHIGPAPLVEDNSARSESSTVVNGRVARSIGNLTVALEALNLFGSDDRDITYYYSSRLVGEPSEGVSDYHFHPIPPRSFRVQARFNF